MFINILGVKPSSPTHHLFGHRVLTRPISSPQPNLSIVHVSSLHFQGCKVHKKKNNKSGIIVCLPKFYVWPKHVFPPLSRSIALKSPCFPDDFHRCSQSLRCQASSEPFSKTAFDCWSLQSVPLPPWTIDQVTQSDLTISGWKKRIYIKKPPESYSTFLKYCFPKKNQKRNVSAFFQETLLSTQTPKRSWQAGPVPKYHLRTAAQRHWLPTPWIKHDSTIHHHPKEGAALRPHVSNLRTLHDMNFWKKKCTTSTKPEKRNDVNFFADMLWTHLLHHRAKHLKPSHLKYSPAGAG